VLGGGGGRGLAHAGALQALEELGFDPDIVVGTSMGAIVGALFAAGYDTAEIQARMRAIDWGEVFTSTPSVLGPDRTIRYPMLSFDLELDPVRVGRGWVGQWRINQALAQLLFGANARARGDFDRLARRYRAVAADLQTGEAVVLSQGDLARAARASMAVPGIFAPVWLDGRILIDGGIVNNLPTDVAHDLGARRVVAIDVNRPPDEIPSQPIAVLTRALDLMQENAQRDHPPADVLVRPRLDAGYTSTTFPSDPRRLFAAGLEATREALDGTPAPGPRRTRPLPPAPDSLHALFIEAPDSASSALAQRIFAGIAPGPYDPEAVLTAMNRLYTTGLFEAVWPRVVEHHDAARTVPVLHVRLDAPPNLSLSFAANYENDRGGRAWASLDRRSFLGPRPALFTAAASLEGLERWVSAAGRVYTLSRPALAWSTGAYLREHQIRDFGELATPAEDVLRTGLWLAMELPHILRDRVTTATLRGEWIRTETGEEGLSAGPLLRFTSLNPNILLVGMPLLIEGETRWGDISYTRIVMRGSHTLAMGPLLVAGIADARTTSHGAPADVLPALGDEHAIPGLRWGQERGRTRVVGGVDAGLPLYGAFVRVRLRVGAVSERLSELEAARGIGGAQLGLIWRSPVATFHGGFGASTGGDRRFDISLGRHF
jgi:predicted acylesterase/phospholipase RssA